MALRQPLAPDDPRHGKVGTYTNGLCKCERCATAKREYYQRLRAKHRPLADEDPRHGTAHAYDYYRCRCERCCAASAAKGSARWNANRETLSARNAANYAENAETRRAWQLEYEKNRRSTPEGRALVRAKRYERLVWQSAGTATAADIAAVFQAAEGRCAYCTADVGEVQLELDHVVPRARGGLHDPDNLAAACRPCNARKSAKDPWEWIAATGSAIPDAPALHRYPKPTGETR